MRAQGGGCPHGPSWRRDEAVPFTLRCDSVELGTLAIGALSTPSSMVVAAESRTANLGRPHN